MESENFVSGPIVHSLKGRLAFKAVRAFDGWQYSQERPGDTLGRQNKFSARGSLDWRPFSNLLVRARAEGWYDHSDPQAPQAVGLIPGNPFVGVLGDSPQIRNYPFIPQNGADPRMADWPLTDGFPGRLHDDFLMESIKAIWNITDTMDLTGIVSHLKMQTNGSPQLQGFDVTETDIVTTADIDTNALEARLSDKWWNGIFDWMVGVNLSHDNAHEVDLADTTNAGALFAVAHIPGFTNGNPITNYVNLNGDPDIRQQAVFLNTDTKIVDDLALNLGVRGTQNNEHFYSCAFEPKDTTGLGLSNLFTALSVIAAAEYTAETGKLGDPTIIKKGECFPLGVNGNDAPFISNLNESNLSGRAALSWKPDPDSLLYASASRGFKAGGFPVLNPARKAQLVPVVQEQLMAYETGTKLSFFDRRLHTDLTGFYYQYKNKQLLTKTEDQIFGPLPILENAPRSHVYGVELDAQAEPIQGLTLQMAGSYIKTMIDEFTGTNSEGKTENFAGKSFNFAPNWQLSSSFDYTQPISQDLEAGFGGDFYYTSQTNGAIDQNPLLFMGGYRTVGAPSASRLHRQEMDHDPVPDAI